MDIDQFNEANLTADISDVESVDEKEDITQNNASPDTSTATLVAELEDASTPVSTIRSDLLDPRRKSISQPVLSSGRDKESGLSKSRYVSKSGRVAVLQVQEDNEELRKKVETLQSELGDAKYREREAVQQLPRSVQDIMEEFYTLQQRSHAAEAAVKEHNELKTSLHKLEREMRTSENQLKAKIHQLSEENEKLRKEAYDAEVAENFTLASETDGETAGVNEELETYRLNEAHHLERIASLENDVEIFKQKLHNAEQLLHDNTAGGKTFVMNGNEAALVAKIDELEEINKELVDGENKMKSIILNYMSKVTKLERQVQAASLSTGPMNMSSFDFGDKSKMLDFLDKVKTELITTAAKNRSLRNECNRLRGADDSIASHNTTFEIGKKSLATALEKCAAAPANLSLADTIDDENQVLLDMVEDLAVGLKEAGYSFRDEALDDPSFAAAGINLNNRSAEMIQMFDNPTFAPEAMDHVSLLNSSMNMILQTSMNATADINDVKVRLSMFRDVMVNMFNRLKSSAALFDEIRQFLVGAGHDEISEKIRDMQLIWSNSAKDAEEITGFVECAERSIHGLQAHISVLEQSLVQTSFVLDHTRRMTLANASELQFSMHAIQDPETDVANVIAEARLEHQIELEKVNVLAADLKTQLAEVTAAKTSAESKVELLSKQLDASRLDNSELQILKESVMSEVTAAKSAETKALQDLEMMRNSVTVLKEQVQSLKDAAHRMETELADANIRLEGQDKDITALTNTRNELASRLTDELTKGRELESRLVEINDRAVELETSQQESMARIAELNRDLSSVHQSLKDKTEEVSTIQKQARARTRILDEQLQASRDNVSEFQRRANELQAEVEALKRPRVSEAEFALKDMSLIHRSTMPHRDSQTKLTAADINRLESELVSVHEELKAAYAMHGKLEAAVHLLVFEKAGDSHHTDLKSAQKNCEYLMKGLEDTRKMFNETKEEISRLQRDYSESGKCTSSAPSQRGAISYQKTPVEPYRYRNKLRQDTFCMTSMANDLAQNLKKAEAAKGKDYQFSLEPLVDDARDLRTRLNELYTLSGYNKENLPSDDIEKLVIQFNLMQKSNEELYGALRKSRAELQDLSRKTGNPDLIARINSEINSIHNVMTRAATSTSVLGSRLPSDH